MRALWLVTLLLAAMAAAGCTQPGEEDPDPVFGACPHWTQRDPALEAGLSLAAGESETHVQAPTDAHGKTVLEKDGHPFDMVLVQIVSLQGNGTVVLNASSADGRDLLVFDHAATDGPRALVEARLSPGGDHAGRRFSVYHASVDQGAEVEPAPIHLTWRAEGGAVQATLALSYWDRICGVAA